VTKAKKEIFKVIETKFTQFHEVECF
jgi:hypothetical protein